MTVTKVQQQLQQPLSPSATPPKAQHQHQPLSPSPLPLQSSLRPPTSPAAAATAAQRAAVSTAEAGGVLRGGDEHEWDELEGDEQRHQQQQLPLPPPKPGEPGPGNSELMNWRGGQRSEGVSRRVWVIGWGPEHGKKKRRRCTRRERLLVLLPWTTWGVASEKRFIISTDLESAAFE